jgi:hypothetical protein
MPALVLARDGRVAVRGSNVNMDPLKREDLAVPQAGVEPANGRFRGGCPTVGRLGRAG